MRATLRLVLSAVAIAFKCGNMNKIVLLSFIIGVFCSCHIQEQNNDANTIKIDLSEIKDLDLKELVRSIQVFPLETNDSCLIAQNHTVQIRNNGIYITNRMKEVLKFDREGKFLQSTLPFRGQGPNEYIIAYSSYVDKEGNLGVYEGFIPRIQEYTKDFNFDQSVKMEIPNTQNPQQFRTYAKLNDSTYLVKDYKDIHFYSVAEGKVVKSIHYEFPDLLSIMTHVQLIDYDGKFHYTHTYSCDTLYYVDEMEMCLKPELIFDFGGQSFNINDLPLDMSAEYYLNYLFETDKIVVRDKINLPDRKYCFFLQGKNSYISCTKENRTTIYKQNEENQLPPPDAIIDNKFYKLVWPDKVEEYICMELVDKEFSDRIGKISEYDNPILICYELN